ncbi:ATP-grasp domain-containing protein [Bradyrhizobium sp. 180]|uniref:D-alanine--D-alanine ligase family protein n=1 Tax=Bradyrhizobium sp. 180 TaxID=2782650 RepID=UPI001FFC1E16|nr:ATP-grasp domain-containing protein [Bradyrhizobium sp. 180]MCK1488898.1 ATP-grasp domain-containing protein [Bradyrhizobium sp. 180]
MKVAVVWNHDHGGVINEFGQHSPEEYSREAVESVLLALNEGGHDTLLCEGDKGMLASLEGFMPCDPQARPSGMVFNMAYGIQGECRYTHVPAMLEMAGVPYTGSSPLGHGIALDKVIAKRLIRDCGVPTPKFRVMRRETENVGDLRFPLVVKPRHESTSLGLQLVHDPAQLRDAVEKVVAQYAQDALVEEYIEGQEIWVGLLGNGQVEALPLLEQDFGSREERMVTWEDKYGLATRKVRMICPAQVDSKLATTLREASVAAFRACLCRDYARVELRIDNRGQPFVLEINSMATLGMESSYVRAATMAGYSFSSLINRILDVARARSFGISPPQ